MRRFLFIPALLLLISPCSKDENKQSSYSEDFPEDYIRKWVQIAYLSSDSYFIPQEGRTCFQLNTNVLFAYYKGGVVNEVISGTYTREEISSVIKLNDGNDKVHSSPVEYHFEIEIKEANDDKAVFITADGALTSTTKVQRK